MIYDCFSFYNELDLLEIRLNELVNAVDRFVLVEAEMTHNGDSKPLYYADNKARFARFTDKIIHVVVGVDDFRAAESGKTFQEKAWMRLNIQRNAISKGLEGCNGDDVVIISDLDEIPRAESVRAASGTLKSGEVVWLVLNAYSFYANLRNASDPIWGNGPKMALMDTFRDERVYVTAPYNHFVIRSVNVGPTATRFREIIPTRRIPDAGWHFSYLGGAKAVVAKVRAFNELGLFKREDLDTYVSKRIASGKSLFGGDRFLPEPIDATFPAFVLANQEKFAYLIFQNVPPQGVRTQFLRKWFRFSACIRRFIMRVLFKLTPKWVRTIIKKMIGIET